MRDELKRAQLYTNRELSWLRFNERVLQEAEDESRTLAQRLRFLGITASNLDEFFMVRMARLYSAKDSSARDISGMTVHQQLRTVDVAVRGFVKRQYRCFKAIKSELENAGVCERRAYNLTKEMALICDRYFYEKIYPLLTPAAVDYCRPLPLPKGNEILVAALIKEEGAEKLALVRLPGEVGRLFMLPDNSYILAEEIIKRNIDKLFKGVKPQDCYVCRLTRGKLILLKGEDNKLYDVQRELERSKSADFVRLECEKGADKALIRTLKESFDINDDKLYSIEETIDLSFCQELIQAAISDCDNESQGITYPRDFSPEEDIFSQIRERDRALFLPYESFDPMLEFIRLSAYDPKVKAIKLTLYRVSENSPIIEWLIEAAKAGKAVTVVLELTARFNEYDNTVYARRLEQAGCYVVYGYKDCKVHSKLALIIRSENEGLKGYLHLGTGNYNELTARQYTDIGLFTCDEAMVSDALRIFNYISGQADDKELGSIYMAPKGLKKRLLWLIKREQEHSLNGQKGHIIAKMNSLCDQEVIDALYEAAESGVCIELIVRGICALKTGIKGGNNIKVISIVGDYLEHGRAFWFENAGEAECYLSSADWMSRNLDHRIELMFPVKDAQIKKRIYDYLSIQLRDTAKARLLMPDDTYRRVTGDGEVIDSQKRCMENV